MSDGNSSTSIEQLRDLLGDYLNPLLTPAQNHHARDEFLDSATALLDVAEAMERIRRETGPFPVDADWLHAEIDRAMTEIEEEFKGA